MEAEEEIVRLGLVLEEAITIGEGETRIITGYKYKRNPAVTISNDAQKLMKSFLIEFGLTPASRSRVHANKKSDEESLEEKFFSQADATQTTAKTAPSKSVN
jgi:P27 family predicted phage terminase small subunit